MEEERRDSGLGKLLGPRWLDRGEGSRACWTFRGKDGEAIRGLSRVPKSLPSSSSLLLRVASPPTPLLLRFCLYPLSILLFASLAVLTLLLFLLLLLYLFFFFFSFSFESISIRSSSSFRTNQEEQAFSAHLSIV